LQLCRLLAARACESGITHCCDGWITRACGWGWTGLYGLMQDELSWNCCVCLQTKCARSIWALSRGELTSDRQLFRKHHSLGFTFLHSLVTRKSTVSGTMKGTVTKSTSDRQPLTVELCLTPWSWSTAESSAQLTELPLSATGSIEQAPLESRLVAILLAFRCDGRLLAGRKMQHSCGPSNTWDLVFPVLFRAPVEEH